jgi:hypothetical protein
MIYAVGIHCVILCNVSCDWKEALGTPGTPSCRGYWPTLCPIIVFPVLSKPQEFYRFWETQRGDTRDEFVVARSRVWPYSTSMIPHIIVFSHPLSTTHSATRMQTRLHLVLLLRGFRIPQKQKTWFDWGRSRYGCF